MKSTFISVIALGVAAALAGPADRAQAGEPMVLTDAQLERVTAGGQINFSLELPGSAAGVQDISFTKIADRSTPVLNIEIVATRPPDVDLDLGALPGGRDPR